MGTVFGLRLRFDGGSINERGLDLYDGSASFHGFARALQITTHAYLNDEAVSKATALKGASLSFSAPRQGSVLFDIKAWFNRRPKSAPLNADAYYDFTKVALSRATGILEPTASTPYVASRLASDQPFFDELAENLEGSLQQAHRSVDNEGAIVTLERPRSPLITFDVETSAWVHTRDEDPNTLEYKANFTRFNTQTGNGRAYIKSLGKIVPVRKSDSFDERNKAFLTWSLHGSHLSTDKDIILTGRKIESANGETKRILIDDCRKA